MSAQKWINLATKRIKKYGATSSVTFSRAVVGAYSTDTLTRTETTPTTYTTYAAPLDFNLKEFDGVTVLQGEKMLWVPGGITQTPAVSDTVNLGGTSYRVLQVVAYETESTNCAWLLKIGV